MIYNLLWTIVISWPHMVYIMFVGLLNHVKVLVFKNSLEFCCYLQGGLAAGPDYPLVWTVLYHLHFEHFVVNFSECFLMHADLPPTSICDVPVPRNSKKQIHWKHSMTGPANYHKVSVPCSQTSVEKAAIL